MTQRIVCDGISGVQMGLAMPRQPKRFTGALAPAALLVSSDADDEIFLKDIFGPHQWKLYAVPTLSLALARLRQTRVPVIISEKDLQKSDWKDVLEQTQDLPHPPLLVVTSRLADEYLWSEALNRGAYDVLAKPFLTSELLRVLDQAWRKQGIETGMKAS